MYRWGPLTHAPSLLSGDGGFPRSIDDLWEHADPEEVERELRTQIERAMAWGIDVTHLAPHLTAITLRPEFFDIYLDLAVEFRLPIRLPSTITADQAGFPFRRLAAEEGVVFPDHFDHDWRAGSRDRVLAALDSLAPGVTEIHVQPAIDTPEVRAMSDAAEQWIDDLALALDPRPRRRRSSVGRHADRLPRAQGCDARRLIASAPAARAQHVEQRTGRTGRLQPALHVGHRGVEPLVLRVGERDVTTSSASSGPSTRSSFLATTTRYWTVIATRCERRSRRRPHALEQVGLLGGAAGIGPTSDRASTHSSHGQTTFSSSSVEPEPPWLVRVDLGGVGLQRRRCAPTGSRRRRSGW